jgi:hypothetical protein
MTLAIITAGTLFKVGDGNTVGSPQNEIQQIVLTGTPSAGNLAVLYSNETYVYERATAAFNATPATFATNIQTALESMLALNPGDVTVVAVDATHFNVTFLGAKAGKNVSRLQVDTSALTGATGGTVNVTQDGHGTGESFTAVAEVTAVPWPTMTRDTQEATPINSLSGYKEFVSGLKDGGEITVTVNYIPNDPTQDQNTGLISQFEGGAKKNMKIVLPDAANTTFNFSGIPTQFAPAGGGPGDILKLNCRFKLTGPVSLTVGG